MMRRLAIGSVALAVSLPQVASAESRAKYGGTLSASLPSDVAQTDPVMARNFAEATLLGLLHEGLYRNTADGPTPILASAAPVFETATRVRIALRLGATFHDASPITANDVVASLERVRTSPSGWLFAAVSSVRADGGAIVLQLSQPTPNLAALLTLPQAAVTPGGRAPNASAPVGAGPFMWGSRDAQRRFIELKAFDGHVNGRPFVDKLRLHWFAASDGEARRFETGAAHISQRGATAFSGAAPKFVSFNLDSLPIILSFVGFGQRHPLARHEGLRRAIDAGLARTGFAALGSGERVVATRIPLATAGGNAVEPTQLAGDMLAAQRAFATVPKAGGALEILVDASALDDREIAERVVRVLDKLGVVGSVSAVDSATFNDRLAKHAYDAYIGQLVLPQNLAPLWWTASYALGTGRAGESAATMAATFSKDMPIVPLFHRSVRAWARNDVLGLGFDGLARLTLDDATLIGAPSKTASVTP